MREMPDEDFIKLYELYLKLHPGKEFGENIFLIDKFGKLVHVNPELTEETIKNFVHHIIKTAPIMHDILNLIKY